MRKRSGIALFLVLCSFTAAAAENDTAAWRGVFEPRAQAILPSEVAMPVAALPAKAGETCRAGDVLVEFDDTVARAALEVATLRLDAAELNYSGQRSLFNRNQSAEIDLARASSDLARARLDAATARRELDACTVRAPFDGRIVDHRVREHEWAGRGAALLLLVDDSVLTVRFFLPEENFPRIAPGDDVRVRAPAGNHVLDGVVSRIGAVFDPASRTFDVWAEVDNTEGLLRAGMTAEVEWPAPGASDRPDRPANSGGNAE